MSKVAIIGGSAEAIWLAQYLHANSVDYCLFETDGYTSDKALVIRPYPDDWIAALSPFSAVVAAPHPFAFNSIANVKNAMKHSVAFCRKPWIAGDRDDWQLADGSKSAAKMLQESNAINPLLAIGRERLGPFLALPTPDLIVRCRKKPLPNLQGRGRVSFRSGPFTESQEVDFMLENEIDMIVAHNAGGPGGWPKLAAARSLGLPVILIERPKINWTHQSSTQIETISWLRQTAGVDVPALSD